MESSDACDSCGQQCVVFDVGTGVFACEACGLVRQDTVLRHVDFDEEGTRTGTYVGGRGTVSALGGGRPAWSLAPGCQIGFRSDRGKQYTTAKLDELASLLRLPKDKVEDVKHMLGLITEEKWSARQWIDVLIATCIYIVARKHSLPLSAAEVAATLNCSVKDILGVYQRVRQFLDFQSTPFDPAVHFDKIVSHHPAFTSMGKEALRSLSKHGHCLLWYGGEWSLAAGRHPLALVAAVVVLVGKANNIKVDLDTVSKELHVNPATSRLRLKEYMTSLVGFAQLLPWGKDITLKTVNRHLPFLLQYLETRVKMDREKALEKTQLSRQLEQHSAVEDTALCHIAKTLYLTYGKKISSLLEKQPFDVVKDEVTDPLPVEQTAPVTKKQKASDAVTATSNLSHSQCCNQAKLENKTAGSKRGLELEANHKLEKKTKTADQSTWKPLPPSFLANKEATAKRVSKIEAAKQRIAKVKQEMGIHLASEGNEDVTDVKLPHSKDSSELITSVLSAGEAKDQDTVLDDEDFLIQYCLIRGADEDILEAGYYLHALSTSPVQPEREVMLDEELLMYFKTPREIKFLKSLHLEDALDPWLTTEELDLRGL